MSDLIRTWLRNERHERLYKKAVTIADEARAHVEETDREAEFSYQTLQVIKQEGYPSLSLPVQLGERAFLYMNFCFCRRK